MRGWGAAPASSGLPGQKSREVLATRDGWTLGGYANLRKRQPQSPIACPPGTMTRPGPARPLEAGPVRKTGPVEVREARDRKAVAGTPGEPPTSPQMQGESGVPAPWSFMPRRERGMVDACPPSWRAQAMQRPGAQDARPASDQLAACATTSHQANAQDISSTQETRQCRVIALYFACYGAAYPAASRSTPGIPQ